MKARKATVGRSADEMRAVSTGCPTPQIIEPERELLNLETQLQGGRTLGDNPLMACSLN